jgi:hypothetical protein
MTRSGPLPTALITLALILCASVASAQSVSIGDAIVTSAGPLSDEQKTEVTKYITNHVQNIVTGEIEKISLSRERLIGPLNHPNVSDPFIADYGSIAIQLLKPAIGSKSTLVRINAFIVVASLTTPKVAETCVIGVADPNPSVRYWATRAAANQSKDTFKTAQQQNKMAASLTKTLQADRNADLAGYSYKALSGLSMPSAEKAIFDALNKRVTMQVNDKGKADLNDGIRADVAAIRTMIAKLNQAKFSGGKADDIRRRRLKLVRPVAKYLVLCTESLALGDLSDKDQPLKQDLQPTAIELVDLADKLFNSVIKGAGIKGKPLQALAKDPKNWVKLYQNTLAWTGNKDIGKGILSRNGVAIPLNDLTPYK